MNKSALGLIEVYGFVGAVAALDVAAKAANIELVSCEFVKGGIVTILITGKVAAVKAAVEASRAEAERLGVLLNTHVIARADENVWNILKAKNNDPLDIEIKDEIDESLSNQVEEKDSANEAIDENIKELDLKGVLSSYEELEKLKVNGLRTIARQMKETYKISLTKKQIKFSKKEQLIEAILKSARR